MEKFSSGLPMADISRFTIIVFSSFLILSLALSFVLYMFDAYIHGIGFAVVNMFILCIAYGQVLLTMHLTQKWFK